MTHTTPYISAGTETEKIDVRLSYGIVSLFSEGLYASPNKAIEELVANSFDAGARHVGVFLPPDFHAQAAAIAVLDNGIGMDAEGLKHHWLIGKSLKRQLQTLPQGRQQIGKFGIGKLASYVLAHQLTHISKSKNKYYATSMDFKIVDHRGDQEVEVKSPIRISLRELSAEEAKKAVEPWRALPAFKSSGMKLFGRSSEPSWTLAILSELKPKVHEIQRGRLEWVLRTALPLRDDFAVYLDGRQLQPSKAGKGRIKRWILGKDITDLAKPAPKTIELQEDKSEERDSLRRHAMQVPSLGRVVGYAEAYRDLLTTGKSDAVGRSHGFFVYVRGRLINVEDGHFGISPDELRHGTFGRIRIVVHIDGLDAVLQSDRERVRQGPVLDDAKNLLRAIFNRIRPELERVDSGEEPGAKMARKFAGSPASIARHPIIALAKASLSGSVQSRYIKLPENLASGEADELITKLESRAKKPEDFVGGVEFSYDATSDDGIAIYDASTSVLIVNGLHPFVGAFFDEFMGKTSGLPLELFAMAEVLLESHLFQAGHNQDQIDEVMSTRDQLLRYVAQESGRRTALSIANALREARNDSDRLEVELVEAFRSLGFDATRLGGKGKPDGVAKAHLSPSEDGKARRYAVSLEAKSKRHGVTTKVKTKTVGISAIIRQRDEFKCDHAIVVAPAFDHTPGNASALSKEIQNDREQTAANGVQKTITTIHVDDLARLVQLRPLKRLDLVRMKSLFTECSLPEECKEWVDIVEQEQAASPPYATIISTIHELQQKWDRAAVDYGSLRMALYYAEPPYTVETNEELKAICTAMSALASYEVTATNSSVELNQSPENVLAAIEQAVSISSPKEG